jgi:SAM-dependent methyltransferase
MDTSDNAKPVIEPVILPAWVSELVRGPVKRLLKGTICSCTDGVDWLLGRRTPLTPPCKLRVRVGCFFSFLSTSRFRAVGEEAFAYLKDLGRIRPSSWILDVGCGCGQVAAPLTRYLDRDARYEGLDADREAIGWCRGYITKGFPNFRFSFADVYNGYYNPGGTCVTSEYVFPYDPDRFDLVVLKSVFTHMLPRDVEHYLSQIARVLKPSGRCLATCYLMNEETARFIERGRSALDFRKETGDCFALNPEIPEYTLAYHEKKVRLMGQRQGLVIETIRPGSWCGRSEFLSFQDIVVWVPMRSNKDPERAGGPADRNGPADVESAGIDRRGS